MNARDQVERLCVPAAEAGALIESLIKEGVGVRIRVSGRSMEPAIRPGDAVTVVPLSRRIRFGDVVLCRRADGSCFIHRAVWRRGRQAWRTKGDALKSLDPPVSSGGVIGLVVSVERADEPGMVKKVEGLMARGEAMARATISLWRMGVAYWTRRRPCGK